MFHDPDAPGQYWKIEAEEAADAAFLSRVRAKVANDYAMYNDRMDHRTGGTSIMRAIVVALVKDLGWSPREAADALVLDAVRTGSRLIDDDRRDAVKALDRAMAVKP